MKLIESFYGDIDLSLAMKSWELDRQVTPHLGVSLPPVTVGLIKDCLAMSRQNIF
jgi:hypothetical protein